MQSMSDVSATPPRRVALAISAGAAYSAVATAGRPWSFYTAVSTAVPGILALGFALRQGWHRMGGERPPFEADGIGVLGLMIWTLLVTLSAVWILATFFSHPRSVYPTLSHLTNLAFEFYPVRAAGFFLWMALGWYLLRR